MEWQLDPVVKLVTSSASWEWSAWSVGYCNGSGQLQGLLIWTAVNMHAYAILKTKSKGLLLYDKLELDAQSAFAQASRPRWMRLLMTLGWCCKKAAFQALPLSYYLPWNCFQMRPDQHNSWQVQSYFLIIWCTRNSNSDESVTTHDGLSHPLMTGLGPSQDCSRVTSKRKSIVPGKTRFGTRTQDPCLRKAMLYPLS